MVGSRARARTKATTFLGIAIATQLFALSCSKSFETSTLQKLDKGSSEIQLVQTERKLRAAGCVFETLPGAKALRDEKLSCSFDPRSQGATAVDDTLAQLVRFDQLSYSIRQHFDIAGANLRQDKREQFEHRLLLLTDAKGDLRGRLRELYDDEAAVQLAIASLGPSGCEVVGARLACEEAIDLAQATEQIEALKRVEEAAAVLFDGHGPILKMPLANYRDLVTMIGSRRVRLEDAIAADAAGGPVGFKILGNGPAPLKTAIVVDGGLFVSAAQTSQVAKSIEGLARLIVQGDLAKELRAKAYRRVVVTPLVSMPVDVDFESVSRTVYLHDTIKPEEAIEFLRKTCAPSDSAAAVKQADGLARLESQSKALRESGDLGSIGLVMEGSIARKWKSALMAVENVRKALELVKADGTWTDAVKGSIRVVAGERFATYGEVEMTLVVNVNESPETIADEFREALKSRQASLARLNTL
ncbi:MAG: hypothetical protein AAB250_00010 [Bdellovibrionota bacterium]